MTTVKKLEEKVDELTKTITHIRRAMDKLIDYLENRTHSKKNSEILWLLRELFWR